MTLSTGTILAGRYEITAPIATGGMIPRGADTVVMVEQTALHDAELEETVSLLVGSTHQVGPWWTSPLELLFLDGNHTEEVAQHDFAAFAPHLTPGAVLAVHDVFPDPADGGQAPWHVVERALGSGAFTAESVTGSLRVLRRTGVRLGGAASLLT